MAIGASSFATDAHRSTIARSAEISGPSAAIARGFVEHEAWAFEAAYDAFAQSLYGAALGVLHDAQEAEDCVHDVLLRLWKHGHSYRLERGSLGAFLTICVRNDAISRARKHANRARIERALARDEAGEDAQIVGQAERERIATAINALSPKQQQAIELAYFQHLTHEQISLDLGEPLGTVKSRISSGLRALRGLLTIEDSADG